MTHPDSQIVDEQRALMQTLAATLDELFNPGAPMDRPEGRKVGFVLLTFPYATPGELGPAGNEPRANYISNGANRKDMASLMREMAARFEGQPAVAPGRA